MISIIQRIIQILTRQHHRRSGRDTGRHGSLHQLVSQPREDGYTQDFYNDLKKTISWTESIIAVIKDLDNINYSKALRVTNPLYEGKSFYTFDESGIARPPEIPFDYEAVLAEAMSLRPASALSLKSTHDLGKVLRFEMDLTTYDGAPYTCSEGFVDWADIPPIDTWFALHGPTCTVGYPGYSWIKCKKLLMSKFWEAMNGSTWTALLFPATVRPVHNSHTLFF